MRALQLVLIIGIVALFVLAGCNTDAQKNYPPSGQRYVGGGCGVAAPTDNSGDAVNAFTATEPTLVA